MRSARARLVHHAAILIEPVRFPPALSTAVHHPVVRGGSPRAPGAGGGGVRPPGGARGRLVRGHRNHTRVVRHALDHGYTAPAPAAASTVVRVLLRVRAVLVGVARLVVVCPPRLSPGVSVYGRGRRRHPRLVAGFVDPVVLRDVLGVVATAVAVAFRRMRGYGVLPPVARGGGLRVLLGLGGSSAVAAAENEIEGNGAKSCEIYYFRYMHHVVCTAVHVQRGTIGSSRENFANER